MLVNCFKIRWFLVNCFNIRYHNGVKVQDTLKYQVREETLYNHRHQNQHQQQLHHKYYHFNRNWSHPSISSFKSYFPLKFSSESCYKKCYNFAFSYTCFSHILNDKSAVKQLFWTVGSTTDKSFANFE